MSEPTPGATLASTASTTSTCARCGRSLAPGEGVKAGDRVFCAACHETLAAELRAHVDALTQDIPIVPAAVGAVGGALLGAAVWTLVVVFTHFQVGIVAILIGWLAGTGAVRFAGGKRGRPLQWIAAGATVLAFILSLYAVNAAMFNHAMATTGDPRRFPVIPRDPAAFLPVAFAGFGIFDVVFLAIAVWQAWSLPRAPRMPPA